MKPKNKKDQKLQTNFAEAHLYAGDDREARKNRSFWKKARSKYLRREGKEEINDRSND